ncbi:MULTISPECIES: TonB-dependent receptor domain-containing protein [Shewanella]|uniref:TonB-dependent receptor n=2 Tax=Gammaproteobacteria TaxID=1236 RepID=A0A3N4E8T2_9GAMM|nr:TonB-dependent receptor [Shewanella psychromarinicola]AZG36782.1 TonB-dependent receptor [Shewanella psychromarinicola]MCL1083893.1 TonB-dependent receptor [Shewanella psychromarinicola]RPA34635.1 TonB-dependent receptor [Shewanella psychromarinicola]|tara:strand:- start:233257 stop:236127 length:2871 start_codon:yes stop_codon:yes gene_type:complete
MQVNSHLAKAIRFALISGVAVSAATTFNTYAEDVANTASPVERISVTGSRIIREGAVAPTPVTVITGDELLSTGVTNIGEALNQLPALGNTYSLANSGRFIGTSGLNLLDLRSMGTARTLVLVNGKRHVSSSAGTSSVDINTIPSVWIDKVEVITGGASAIYGADAVTGVVNFILKKNVNGLDVSATKGWADDSGHNKDRFSLSYGTNFAQNDGNVAFAVEYSAQEQLRAFDRDQTSTAFTSLANSDRITDNNDPSDPDKIWTPNAGHYTISNAGNVNLDGWKSFNPDGSLTNVYSGQNVDGIRCADCDFTNLNQFVELQPEFERYNINFKTNYQLNDNHNVYFEAKYVNSQSTDEGQPAFFFGNPVNDVQIDNAFINPELVALMKANKDSDGNAAPLDSINVRRFMTDLGVRIEDDTRETQRYVFGLEGLVFDDWDYDVYAIYGQTDLERVNKNNLVYDNYSNALDSVLENGVAVCRDQTARDEGCVPVNIFGFGAPSQDAIDYINTTSTGTSIIKQTVLGGTLTNSYLFELPAGYVGLSTGVEYRKEESEVFEPDNAEGTFFNALGEDKGDFDVNEIFAEVTLPLLADLPMVRQLDLDLAVRYADYSTIGNATTWKTGLSWEVDDQLRLRTTYSEAIRAPNISELYGSASQNFFNVNDSCRAKNLNDLADPTLRQANCTALGIPAGFDADYDDKTLEGLSGGNRELKAEESKSYTLGVVYQPDYIDGLSITTDYWNIEIENAISAVGAQDIIDRCVDSPSGVDNEYCSLITRDATSHEITQIRQFSLNIASLEAAGIDFDIGYIFEAFNGDVRTNLIATRLLKRKDFSFQDEPDTFEELAGTAGYAEWQANWSLGYSINSWDVNWRTRYVEGVSLYTDKELALNANPNSNMEFSDYFISDVAVTYNFDSGIKLKFGIDNLFNRDLPYGYTGTDTTSSAYDNVGRFFHTTATYKF